MNVYEYSLHAVGFIPGDCEVEPSGHIPILTDMGRIRCDACNDSGPLAHEWSEPIKRAVLIEAKLEAVG